ncbi:hypothetical protein TNIN_158231 [Trichonephila inaurata madagascariensis]|uniref:Uncharacterized protein n=1 Tax=Trichonephila inaurata madagascariensis TaxID=2747483 RepID=A0A8X7BR77_9ARAC|nr:hypothetical protein TNIN_158231 [Trichonephila inaurata madagascariensis]
MPTLPAQRLAEPERMPTLPAEPERISPAEPERMTTFGEVPSTIYSWDPLSVECTYEKTLPPSLYYKSRAQKPVASFYSQDMEDELAFTLNLALYQEADLGDYITFMMKFRTVLNSLKPSEVIQLETVYAMDIIDLLVQVLPDHEPHDVPWFECFSYFEPADLTVMITWAGAAKGKAPLSKPCGLNMPNLNCTVWCINGDMGLKTLYHLAYWLKRCWAGVLGRNGPIAYFLDACPICLGPGATCALF